ncbi:MAG: hypothetical protein ACRDHC_09175 [Actinomycetota bacterium]
MEVLATPEVRSMIRENGGLLFVRLSPLASIRGAMRRLLTSTSLPEDALDHQRFETKGFVVFLAPGIGAPREPHLQIVGRLHRRMKAFGTAVRSCP